MSSEPGRSPVLTFPSGAGREVPQGFLASWFERFLRSQGADTEWSDGGLTVLSPRELARDCGWGELEQFSFRAGGEGRLVSYDSDVLERLRPVLEETSAFAELWIRESASASRKESLARKLLETIAFSNASFRYQGAREAVLPYLCVFYRATAISEQKREALLSVVVNCRTGASVESLASRIERLLTQEGRICPAASPLSEIAGWSDRVNRLAERAALPLFSEFERSLGRRLARDVARLREYFGSIEAELARKAERRNLDGEGLSRIKDRIAATRAERDRKLADQRSRYALEIRLQPVAVLRVWIAATLLDARVLRRKLSREIVFTDNPVVREIERPACESCGEPVRQIWACDLKVHLLCRGCANCSRCGRPRCGACGDQMRRCCDG